jgi:hypothetical protein
MINVNKIFDNFKSEDDSEEVMVDYKTHPIYFILKFKKELSNYLLTKTLIINNLKKADSTLDTEELTRAGDDFVFNKAYDNIKKFNINDPWHVECLSKQQNLADLMSNLDRAREYFVVREDWDKCIFLRDLLSKCGEIKDNMYLGTVGKGNEGIKVEKEGGTRETVDNINN